MVGSGESFGDRTVADAIVGALSIRRAGCYRDDFADGNGPENYFSPKTDLWRHVEPKRWDLSPSAPILSEMIAFSTGT
jgi:hypothetical protein